MCATQTAADPAIDYQRGVKLLHDPVRNKGTAFTEVEREALGLRGLLPPRVHTQDLQVRRVLENLRGKPSDLERYIFLTALQDRNETLFYRVIVDNLKQMMPIIYTPTVGKACQEYGHIFRRPRGLYVTSDDRGRIADVLRNWPHGDVRVIVVTDGERILGLGDLGADGMGIPVGKLALYTACAGIPPTQCLPITLDVGTDNQALLNDPLYIGLQHRRIRGAAFEDLVEEFVLAVTQAFPRTLLQFEDFATADAFNLLAKYRDRICCFNDDIQGTGSVALAGLHSAARIAQKDLTECTFLFLGAGEAGIGIADTILAALMARGMSEEEARARSWFVDSKGLVVASRKDLAPHKRAYAHDREPIRDLYGAVAQLKPDAIVGVSGVAGAFSQPVLEKMGEIQERPIVFALSNPTANSECTAHQAYEWTGGRAVFASGSPFDAVDVCGHTFVPGQGNNAYIFPGVGLGVVASGSRRVTDEMFSVAAEVLADQVTDRDLSLGRVYPSLTRIREVSAKIATAVANVAHQRGLARAPRPPDLEAFIASQMFEPDYRSLV